MGQGGPRRIVVFDVLSHEFMHHPFNEAYLRVLRAAFPRDHIAFHADAGHIARLRDRLADETNISFHATARLAAPKGWSLHNPVIGRRAALDVWGRMRRASGGGDLRLAALLGFDANLISVLRRMWHGRAPLHLIAHNQVAASVRWRSRNPLVRGFDLIAGMRQALPAPFKVIALELGIAEAMAALAPAWRANLATLEHPILVSEWVDAAEPAAVLNIGFLGHASRSKGFDVFLDIARQFAGPAMRFHAIGLAAPEALEMDLAPLARPPSRESVPRPDYVAAMGAMDFICLPLNETYRYVASGSVIDAVAAGTPVMALRTDSMTAIAAKYGDIGPVADNAAALGALFADPAALRAARPAWVANVLRMRAARAPAPLGAAYKILVGGA